MVTSNDGDILENTVLNYLEKLKLICEGQLERSSYIVVGLWFAEYEKLSSCKYYLGTSQYEKQMLAKYAQTYENCCTELKRRYNINEFNV